MVCEAHHTDAIAKFIIILENKLNKVIVRAKTDPTSKVEDWVSL